VRVRKGKGKKKKRERKKEKRGTDPGAGQSGPSTSSSPVHRPGRRGCGRGGGGGGKSDERCKDIRHLRGKTEWCLNHWPSVKPCGKWCLDKTRFRARDVHVESSAFFSLSSSSVGFMPGRHSIRFDRTAWVFVQRVAIFFPSPVHAMPFAVEDVAYGGSEN